MWNEPSEKELVDLPKLYATDGLPIDETALHMHFFLNGSDWYVAEYDGMDAFFGYVILNGDIDMAEWGYFSFKELKRLKDKLGMEVDRDMHWTPKKASQIQGVKTYE